MTQIFLQYLDYVIAVVYVAALWVVYMVMNHKFQDTCYCDDAEQGKNCRNCQFPRLPR